MANPPPSRSRGVFLLIAIIAVVALVSFFGGRRLHSGGSKPLTLSASQEVALGLKAMPVIAEPYGSISHDAAQVALVQRVGNHLATASDARKSGWHFSFYVLGDADQLNAFGLPGGQILITAGLLNRLKTEGELAAVLAHQMAHVVSRDMAKQLAAKQLTAGLVNANDDAAAATEMQMLAAPLVDWKNSADSELAADRLAIQYLGQSGYSPNAMMGLLRVLSTAYYAKAPVPYFTTHPNPASRIENIQQAIKALYPEGIPSNLSQ